MRQSLADSLLATGGRLSTFCVAGDGKDARMDPLTRLLFILASYAIIARGYANGGMCFHS